jgi:phage protein U
MMARLDRRSRAGDYTQRSLATVKIGTAEAKTFTLALVRRESDLLQVKSAVSQI